LGVQIGLAIVMSCRALAETPRCANLPAKATQLRSAATTYAAAINRGATETKTQLDSIHLVLEESSCAKIIEAINRSAKQNAIVSVVVVRMGSRFFACSATGAGDLPLYILDDSYKLRAIVPG
jgi:hypothetical protein